MRVCWNCCHRPTPRITGCDRREANIWNATSMPMVKSRVVIASQAPTHRMASVISCSSVPAAVLKLLASVRVRSVASRCCATWSS